jgi:hypothetical protein
VNTLIVAFGLEQEAKELITNCILLLLLLLLLLLRPSAAEPAAEAA